MSGIALAIISFALAVGVIVVLIKLAPSLGLLDQPDYRKHHDGAIPAVGGLALYAVLMAMYLFGAATSTYTTPLLIAATFVTLIGAFDDRAHISPRLRLIMHFIVALIIVYGADIRLDHLGAIAPNGDYVTLGPLATTVTIFGIMSVINAMNFIDGLDGLAGGLALIAAAGLWVIFAASGNTAPDLLPIMTGSIAAFLIFNARWFGRKRAALFLGDAGSTLLGVLLVWLMVDHSQGSDNVISPVTALWLLAVPLIDFLAIVIRRIAMRRNPLHSDREHLHHVLARATNNDAQTVAVILTVAVACATVGLAGQLFDWPKNMMFYAFLGLFVLCICWLKYSWRLDKLIRAIGAPRVKKFE